MTYSYNLRGLLNQYRLLFLGAKDKTVKWLDLPYRLNLVQILPVNPRLTILS